MANLWLRPGNSRAPSKAISQERSLTITSKNSGSTFQDWRRGRHSPKIAQFGREAARPA
jgi:hypothetical protein